jgi:hypothetical protein
MRVRVMDLWFHEQDVSEATGRPGRLDGLAAAMALDEISAVLGYVVGKKAGAPPGAAVRFERTGGLARRIDVAVSDRARVADSLREVRASRSGWPASVSCGSRADGWRPVPIREPASTATPPWVHGSWPTSRS